MVDPTAIARAIELPPELVVLGIAASPIFELRGAIPAAVGFYGMTPLKAFGLGVAGNVIPVVPLLLLLGPVSNALSYRSRIFERFFSWLFRRTRRRGTARYRRWGAFALVPFVAVPLPVTGAWTGCAAAFVFGVPFRYALPAIVAGILISGAIVTSTVAGATWLLAPL